MTRMLLVRHGQSEWNAAGPLAGPGRPAAVALGRQQARAAADRLGTVDAIVASDLDRAMTTAAIIGRGPRASGPVLVEPRLRERSAGEWSGLTRERDRASSGPATWPSDDAHRASSPTTSLLARTRAALDDLAAAHPGAEILVVTHGGVVYVLESDAGLPFARLPNLSGRWLTHDGDGVRLGERVELVDEIGPTTSLTDQTSGSERRGPAGRDRPQPPRRKTVSAELVDGVVRVLVPSWMSAAEVDRHVAELVPRLERRLPLDARRPAWPGPASWPGASTCPSRPRSCGPRTSAVSGARATCTRGEIRLSRRLADYPSWVLDYVLVHELAHLVHADHSPAFRALVDRYPRAERARGFLIAKDDDAGRPAAERRSPTR